MNTSISLFLACLLALGAGAGCASSPHERAPAATPATEPYPGDTYAAPETREHTPKPPVVSGSAPQTPDIGGDKSESRMQMPIDQGNDAEDLAITKKIRELVMSDDDLSFHAKNVDIVTADRKVILRGSVKSTRERADVERCAREVDGVRDIDNELVVTE